jgi:putative MATE family efflux protein
VNLSGAFGAAIGVGASTFISVKLGQRDYDTAENILGNTLTLNILIGLSFSIICLLFLDPILRFFGASDQTIPYARDYMVIILVGNVVTHLYFGLNAVLRSASKPRQAMFATIFTVVINAILDPIFIWPLHMGIQGAAYATVLAQLLALAWQLRIFANPQELLHFRRGIYKLKGVLVKNIIGIGISPFAMNVCSCIVVIFINNQLVRYGGDMAVGAYGIANKIAFIFIMFVMGVNQGMQPIAGYNYGSQQLDRMMRVLNLSIIAATCIMVSGWLIAIFFPYYCVRLFTTNQTLIKLSIDGLRIVTMMFPIIGFQMVITNFFQCIGKVKVSIFLSLSRQLLFLLPALAVLPKFFGLGGVWASMPVSDATASIITAGTMFVYMRKFKRQHNNLSHE